ncbi:DUF2332 domain-containing protein [Alteribacter natronophilus]|nr:DUF2332 domain-containing protein [Alteribacter natronophilus]
MECRDSSPLYDFLSRKIAGDEEILKLAMSGETGQPAPNLLFASVQDLLLRGEEHELSRFYPSITDVPDVPENSWNAFRDFCGTYRQQVTQLMQTRRVQTNEIRRCAYLFPVFSHIYARTGTPLSMIEIGTSAGLQLLWDRYSYSYGDGHVYGSTESDVHLTSEVTGQLDMNLRQVPPVAARTGVDLNVLDVTADSDRRWLDALIWPEHSRRREQFTQACRIMEKDPVPLVEGDGVKLLPKIASGMPDSGPLVVFHTHVANQMPEDVKQTLLETVYELGRERDVYHVYNNMHDRLLHADAYLRGNVKYQTVGKTDGHARWFEWTL